MANHDRPRVIHNAAASRFEVDGTPGARLEYSTREGAIVFTHTEVPPEWEGKGVAGALAAAGLGYARQQGVTVVPRCPFVRSYIQRHPEYQDLVRQEAP